jgi:pyruvyltransferase
MTHEQWFDNGVGKIVNSPIKFFDPSLKKSQQHWYKYGILSQWKLFKEKFPNPTFEPFIETHQISIFSKQACIDAKNMYPELYDKTLSMKGRVEEDYIGRLLFNYIAIQKGYCIFNKRPPSIAYYSKANLFKPITNVPYLLCTNLNSMMSKKKYTQYMQFMLDIFPKPHPSETYLSYESTCYYRYKDVNMCKNTPILDKKTDTIPKTFFKKGGAYTRKKQIPRRNHTQKKKIALYYSQGHYKNLGDGINPLIFNHFLKHTPTYQNILKAPAHRKIYHILGIGSILSRRTDIDTSAQIVCGSGFIYEDSIPQKPLRIISVRGPLTRQKFLDAGIDCPKVYGDMALLIRYIIKQPLHIQKKFKYGIIPHIVDKEHPFINENAENTSYKIIDIQQSDTPENFVREIHECEAIISSSLHGIIICDSYNIPAHHIKISDKLMGGVWKFKDYYASVGRPYTSIDITQPLTNIVLPAYKVHFDFDSYYTYMKKELGKL